MKWFKHLSNARDDERIADLEDRAGLEGYGFYFKLLEIVAASMDQTDRCEVTYSISRWATLTNCHPIKARTLVGKVASSGLVEPRFEGDRLTVAIPNLLKHRDNHTKNLQAAGKQEVEVEKEQEINRRKRSPSADVLASIPPRFAAFWEAYPGPRKIKKALCLELWNKQGLEAVGDQIVLHVGAMAASPSWKEQDGKFVPSPLVYLNQRRFEDGMPESPRPRLVI